MSVLPGFNKKKKIVAVTFGEPLVFSKFRFFWVKSLKTVLVVGFLGEIRLKKPPFPLRKKKRDATLRAPFYLFNG